MNQVSHYFDMFNVLIYLFCYTSLSKTTNRKSRSIYTMMGTTHTHTRIVKSKCFHSLHISTVGWNQFSLLQEIAGSILFHSACCLTCFCLYFINHGIKAWTKRRRHAHPASLQKLCLCLIRMRYIVPRRSMNGCWWASWAT